MTTNPKVFCEKCFGTREVTEPAHEATFLRKVFMVSARQVACPDCSVAWIRGVRTHATTKQESIVRIKLTCRPRELRWILGLEEGGVTGYENCYVDDYFLDDVKVRGWLACSGSDRYDKLFIPMKEMREGLTTLRLC